MNQLINNSLNIQYPIWAWQKYDGKTKKPRTQSYKDYKHGVLLELDIDESQIVLTDFEKWNDVLNNTKIMSDEEWEKVGYIKKFSQKEIEKSWSKIFDIEESHSVQATFWEIKPEDVVKIYDIN